MRVFEAFAGIGAQKRSLDETAGQKFEMVGMAEWFVPAIISYETMHHGFNKKDIVMNVGRQEMEDYLSKLTLSMDSKVPVNKKYWSRININNLRIYYSAIKLSHEERKNIFDVRKLHERTLAGIDLLTYSFPCQDLSQQGKQSGMSKNSKTRSGLLWEIEKALDATPKIDLPKYLLMENVSAITNKINISDFNEWTKKLESMGYVNDYKTLNAAEFGSSQARKRVFMISSLNHKVELPTGTMEPGKIEDVLNVVTRDEDLLPALYPKMDFDGFRLTKSRIRKTRLVNYTNFNSEAYVYDPLHVGPTLTASGANSRIKIFRDGQIRKMNAEEAYKYMGFTAGNDYKAIHALNIINETKMIYTCGNSISVEVLKEIMRNISNDFNERWANE